MDSHNFLSCSPCILCMSMKNPPILYNQMYNLIKSVFLLYFINMHMHVGSAEREDVKELKAVSDAECSAQHLERKKNGTIENALKPLGSTSKLQHPARDSDEANFKSHILPHSRILKGTSKRDNLVSLWYFSHVPQGSISCLPLPHQYI